MFLNNLPKYRNFMMQNKELKIAYSQYGAVVDECIWFESYVL